MLESKLVVGNKYTPHSKSTFGSLEDSGMWQEAKVWGQNFLYYNGKYDGNHIFHYLDGEYETIGDSFLASDVEPYIDVQPVYGSIYARIQAESTFEVGDLVTVTHKVPQNDLGWQNSWMHGMDIVLDKPNWHLQIKYIDKAAGITLARVDDHGNPMPDFAPLSMNYPVHVLKLVSKAPKFNEVRISEDYTAKVFSDRIEVGCQKISLSKFDELVKLVNQMRK